MRGGRPTRSTPNPLPAPRQRKPRVQPLGRQPGHRVAGDDLRTGTEDYFCGSYNFDVAGRYVEFTTPYASMPQVLPDGTYRS